MGKYEVLEELGSGAMGVVYKARDPIINRLVALKKIKANVADSPALLERFYREAQSAGSLQHPNIVTIYEMGDEGGVPFIAMQLVDGQNLSNVIAQRQPIPLSLKLVYAVEACRAFAYAHKQGIVHRDIKPGNVMVSKDGAVKVVDFGIARVLENSKTQTGLLIGTFAYMPPEVFNGEHADERSDIFSFGVLLYELFSYKHPFPGDIPASLMQSICLKEPAPLREAMPDCPPELEAAVHRTLVKSVTERTQSMEDLLLELDSICKGLQAQTSADLVARAKTLIQDHEFASARELLVQALQIDFTNRAARGLLDEVNAELKRILIRPKVERHVNAGRAFLGEGKIQEAQIEAESALKFDPSFEPAEDLLRQVQEEIGRAKLIKEWLQASSERLAEGLPEEAEAFLDKIRERDPANRQAAKLQQQVLEEKERRQKRIYLLETMQQARGLWMQQKYDECIDLLTSLQKEFGDEEEVQKLLLTAREDRAEYYKRQTLERARTLLAAGKYGECKPLLTSLRDEFPGDEEIPSLLEQVRKDEAEHRKLEMLHAARNLLSERRYEDCLVLLESLKTEYPEENEIAGLVEAVHADRQAEKKEQGLQEARSLLASQRYEECRAQLTELQGQFPADPEIRRLLDSLLEEQKEQLRLEGLSEARKLFASKQYAESLSLLSELKAKFPEDREIPALADEVHRDQAEQRRLQGMSQARKLLASRQYTESLALLSDLKTKFPDDKEIPALADEVRKDQDEQRRLQGLSQAQKLHASKQYAESLAQLEELKEQFPGDRQILALAEEVQRDQAEQLKLQGLAEARKLRASRQYAESLELLGELKKQFPADKRIPSLSEEVRKDQLEQQKFQGLSQAQKLLASRQHAESLALLTELKKQFPDDKQILTLADEVRRDQAEQQKLQGLAEARKLRASRQYTESLALLSELQKQFPADNRIPSLAEEVQKDQTEQRKQEGLLEARQLLASKQYAQSLALLGELGTRFPGDKEILRLAEAVRKDQAEQLKQEELAKARKLRASKQYTETLGLLSKLQTQFPDDKEIPRLVEGIRKDQAEQRKLEGLSEARNLLTSRRLEESLTLLVALRKEFPNEGDIARLLITVEQEKAEEQKQQRLADARSLLASQRFNEALAALEPLLPTYSKDASVVKLRRLVLDEQEKVAKSSRLAGELKVLKKLVSDESYETAITRAEALLPEFANEDDLVRLLEFARNRKEQVERGRRLNQILEEVQKSIASNRLADAISAARRGLESFEGNSDLKRLLDQAESQQKKEYTRLRIQQQIREIKIKINREEFSDAVRLAQDALTTLGPDTGLNQLLNSAKVETQSRDKKRVQGQMLERVRALLERGDMEGATLVLDNTIKSENLDPSDPRVVRLSTDIAAAMRGTQVPVGPPTTADPTKEYALLEGPPPVESPEKPGITEEQAAATISPNPASSSLPQSEPAVQPEAAPDPLPVVAKIDVVATSPEAGRVAPPVMPLWRRPAMLAAELLGLILVLSVGANFLRHPNSSLEVRQPTPQPVAPPAKNLAETQQRDLIGAADADVGKGDFRAAKSALEQAKNINGPLNQTIDQKLAGVNEAIDNTATAAVLAQEERLWSQAVANSDSGKFAEAQKDLRAILTLPAEGRRKADARQYLTEVLPRRQREEQLFAQAQQAMNGKNSGSLQQAADLFGEAAKLNGPRQQAALKNQQDALAALKKTSSLSALADSSRAEVKRGDFRSARQMAAQIQQSGGDAAAITQEINAAELARFAQLDSSMNQLEQRNDEASIQSLRDLQLQLQALADGGGPSANDARRDAAAISGAILSLETRLINAREETAYQQAVQRYHANPSDKGALESARSEFQSIAKGTGRRATDAQKMVNEIDAVVAALNQPAGATAAIRPPDETPAVLAAVQRYADAYDRRDADAVRQAWPAMPSEVYGRLKTAFGSASGIQLTIANEKVEFGADGKAAVVNADITQNYTPKGDKAHISRDHTVFHLSKGDRGWVITDLK